MPTVLISTTSIARSPLCYFRDGLYIIRSSHIRRQNRYHCTSTKSSQVRRCFFTEKLLPVNAFDNELEQIKASSQLYYCSLQVRLKLWQHKCATDCSSIFFNNISLLFTILLISHERHQFRAFLKMIHVWRARAGRFDTFSPVRVFFVEGEFPSPIFLRVGWIELHKIWGRVNTSQTLHRIIFGFRYVAPFRKQRASKAIQGQISHFLPLPL